jgi:hypothetical protein
MRGLQSSRPSIHSLTRHGQRMALLPVVAALELLKLAVKDTQTVAFSDAPVHHDVWEQLIAKSQFGVATGAHTAMRTVISSMMGATKCLLDGVRASTSIATTMLSASEKTGSMFSVAIAVGNSGGAPVVQAPVQDAAAGAAPPVTSGGAGSLAAGATPPQQKGVEAVRDQPSSAHVSIQ